MSYHLETLGDERFQQLCQALLVQMYPDLVCLPVGQPDGGRDAFRRKKEREFAIYQVKFVKDPSAKTSRELIQNFVKTERNKIQKLVARGAKAYFLLTNASGTAHLEAGSVDRINDELSAGLGIEASCYWRDDIERRIDGLSAVKWSFPEILRATDVLEILLRSVEDPESKRRQEAIKSYVAHQWRQDAHLKFKQIELQKTITDLFVDVPAKVMTPPNVEESDHLSAWLAFFEANQINHLALRTTGLRSPEWPSAQWS